MTSWTRLALAAALLGCHGAPTATGRAPAGVPNHGHRGSMNTFGSTLTLFPRHDLVVAVLVYTDLDDGALAAIDAVIEGCLEAFASPGAGAARSPISARSSARSRGS